MCLAFLIWFSDGEILAVACTGNPLDPILYCKLIVQKDKGNSVLDEYQISSEALTGFFPQLSAGHNQLYVMPLYIILKHDFSLISYFMFL